MATNYPSKIEWIEQTGFAELRRRYKEFLKDYGVHENFDSFVDCLYDAEKMNWEQDMFHQTNLLSYEMDLEQDMCLESAKFVLVKIINNAICKGNVGSIVVNEELGPDHETSLNIVNDFMHQLIPAVDRMLKGFK